MRRWRDVGRIDVQHPIRRLADVASRGARRTVLSAAMVLVGCGPTGDTLRGPAIAAGPLAGPDMVLAVVQEGYGSPLADAAISDDGRRFVSSAAGTIKVVDLVTERVSASWRDADTVDVTALSLNPTGERLAALHDTDGGRVRQVGRLWDLTSGRRLKPPWVENQPLRAVKFSPGGRWLGVATHEGRIRLWNQRLRIPARSIRPNSAAEDFAFSDDDRCVVIEGEDSRLSVFDLDSENSSKPRWRSQFAESIESSFFGSGCRYLYAYDETTIALYDLETLDVISVEVGASGLSELTSAQISPNGKLIASCHDDGVVAIWDAITLRLLDSKKIGRDWAVASERGQWHSSGALFGAAVSGGGFLFISVSGTTIASSYILSRHGMFAERIRISRQSMSWVGTGSEGEIVLGTVALGVDPPVAIEAVISSPAIARIAAFGRSPGRIAVSYADRDRLLDPTAGSAVAVEIYDGEPSGEGPIFADNGRLLITSTATHVQGATVPEARTRWKLPLSGEPSFLAVGADDRTLAVGNRTGEILLVDSQNGFVRNRLQGHSSGARDGQFDRTGRYMVVTSGDMEHLTVWDVSGRDPVSIRDLGRDGTNGRLTGNGRRFLRLKVAENAPLLAVERERGSLEFWETESWTRRTAAVRHDGLSEWALSADGNMAATVGFSSSPPRPDEQRLRNEIRIWRVRDGMLLASLQEDTSTTFVAFIGRMTVRILSGTMRGEVNLWDLRKGLKRDFVLLEGGYVRSIQPDPATGLLSVVTENGSLNFVPVCGDRLGQPVSFRVFPARDTSSEPVLVMRQDGKFWSLSGGASHLWFRVLHGRTTTLLPASDVQALDAGRGIVEELYREVCTSL